MYPAWGQFLLLKVQFSSVIQQCTTLCDPNLCQLNHKGSPFLVGLHKSFLWKDNSSFLACVCCYLTFSDDAWFWLYVITVLMEINTGNSVHHLDYRKNYMFSHTAITIKKKNFTFRQNLEERHGDSNISKFSQQIWKGTCGFSTVFLPNFHSIVTIHNAE